MNTFVEQVSFTTTTTALVDHTHTHFQLSCLQKRHGFSLNRNSLSAKRPEFSPDRHHSPWFLPWFPSFHNMVKTNKKTSRLQDNKVKVVPIFHVFEQFTRTRKSHGTDAARFFGVESLRPTLFDIAVSLLYMSRLETWHFLSSFSLSPKFLHDFFCRLFAKLFKSEPFLPFPRLWNDQARSFFLVVVKCTKMPR